MSPDPSVSAGVDGESGKHIESEATASEAVEDAGGSKGGLGDGEAETKAGHSGVGRVGLGLDGVTESDTSTVETSPMHPTLLPEPPELSSHPADALHAPDSPTTSLITSLRDQLRLLSDQSQQLNTKLVESISRHADLLDQHEALQSTHAQLNTKAEGLAKDKRQWEESMKTGLLVERDAITGEMQRLAAGLVEEERRRGSAEERRRKVEDEVDELAATLFDQANTMVASERHGRIEAEERLKSTEDNLAAAEAAMRDMQLHLQSMPTSTVPPQAVTSLAPKRRYLASHLPYTEFTSFLTHLRSLRPLKESSKSIFPPPLVSALATQPLLARTVIEDHDPALRLDVAPDLSWLSRRGISAAIISGDLIIEPVSANTVLSQTTTPTHELGCALCGKPVFPHSAVPQSPAVSQFGPPPLHPTQRNSNSRFSLKPFFNAPSPSSAPSPTQSPAASPGPAAQLPSVYIFRVVRPASASTADKEKENTAKSYPLCRTGWCLDRLRATCELWHFVRTGIIHVVWHGDDGYVLQAEVDAAAHTASASIAEGSAGGSVTEAESKRSSTGEVPPELPRRKSGWGLGFRMGEKSSATTAATGGGGWTKAFRTGVSGSPPVSPRLPPPGEEKENDMTIKESNEGEKLGAPLELENEKVEELAPGQVAEKEKTAGEGAGSSGTPDSVDDAATFSTPQQEQSSFPAVEDVKPDGEEEAKATLPKVDEVTLNSPKTDLAPARPPPPPIPRRAAARNRASIVIDGPSQNGTPSGSGTATPVEQEISAPTVTATSSDEPRKSAEAEPVSERGTTSMDVPPLPAKQPRTPTIATHAQTERAEGEKVYLKEDDDSWEARTWRQVVKLKEGMQRARLGISEEESR